MSTELLPDGLNYVDNGDVLPLDEPSKPYEPLPGADEYEQYCQREQEARSSDFSKRNAYLNKMSKEVGKANQAAGAAYALQEGRLIPRYRSAEHASEVELRAAREAQKFGEAACAVCQLREFCSMSPKDVRDAIQDAAKRKRLISRVASENNNKLCKENLQPGRLKKIA